MTTLAGNGAAGYGGDGGGAAGAILNGPQGVELDSASNLYIADSGNQRVREVTAASGTIVTAAGDGTPGYSGDGGSPLSASLWNPSGVFVDKAGGLWIADTNNRLIRSVGNTPTGDNVPVTPVSSTTGTSPVALNFSTVTSPGNVSLTESATGPAVPSGFELGSPATYYMLTASAVYSGSIQICIDYAGISFSDPSQLSIWHYDTSAGGWTQLSTSVNTATMTACATTPSLSPFALMQPAQAPQTITFTPPPSPVTYGIGPTTLSATATSGLSVTFSVISGPGMVSGNTLRVIGAGAIVIAANQPGNANYSAATQVTQTVMVNRAILTVAANNISVPYGTTPVLSAAITGFVNGDTLSVVSGAPALATKVTSTSLPGSYPISIGQGTLSAANYSFATIGGTFTVTFTASVPAKGTLCNGAFYGTFNGNLTISAGQICIFIDGVVTGNIQQSGGTLEVIQSTVDGNLQVTGGGLFTVTSSSVIKGNLTVQSISAGSVTNQVCGSTVDGNLQFQSNGTAVLIGAAAPASCPGNIIDGNLTIQSNTSPVSVVGNTVKGNITVQSNSGATIVNNNKVGGNLQDQSNTASTQVFNDVVSNNLLCQSNTAITGGGDTAASKKQQCSAF